MALPEIPPVPWELRRSISPAMHFGIYIKDDYTSDEKSRTHKSRARSTLPDLSRKILDQSTLENQAKLTGFSNKFTLCQRIFRIFCTKYFFEP